MNFKAFLAAIAAATIGSSAVAQFVDNGGAAGNADTSAFGQQSAFDNASTTFDGVQFRLLRLINEPGDASKLRMVGEFVSNTEEDRWILFVLPFPRVIDELGNNYDQYLINGVEACRVPSGYSDKGSWSQLNGRFCTDNENQARSKKLSVGAPVVVSIGFQPGEGFSTALAELATFGSVSFSLAISSDGFAHQKNMKRHDVSVTQVPMPR